MLPVDLTEAKDYIVRLTNELRSFYRKRNEQIDEMHDLYFLDHFKGRGQKAGETLVATNKATNIVDLAVGILTSNPMRIHADRVVSETEEDEREESEVEKYLSSILYINNERMDEDIEVQLAFDVLNGGGCIRHYWDSDIQPSMQQDEMGMQTGVFKELPIGLEVVDIRNVFGQEGGPKGKYRAVIHATKRKVRDIEDEWGVSLKDYPEERQKDKEIDYYDYWGWEGIEPEIPEEMVEEFVSGAPLPKKEWGVINAVLCGNEFVKEPTPMPHYDDLPFTFFPGRKTTRKEPERQSLPLLFPNKDKFRDLEEQMIRYRRIVDLYSALPMVIKTVDGREFPDVEAVIGKTIALRLDEIVEFPRWPGVAPDVMALITHTMQEIQEGGFPSVAYGEGPGTVSGYGISLLTEAGRVRLNQFQRSIERGWTVLFRKLLTLTANAAGPNQLQVYGRKDGQPYTLNIMGADVSAFRVDVEIKPKFPQDEARNVTSAAQIKAQNMMSLKSIQSRYLDVEHPDEELDRMLLEAVMQNPDFMKAKIEEVVGRYSPRDAQVLRQQAEQTRQQNAQAQAMVGQPPIPPTPEAELPASAMMPQEMVGIMPPQATGGTPPGQQMPPELLAIINQIVRGGGI